MSMRGSKRRVLVDFLLYLALIGLVSGDLFGPIQRVRVFDITRGDEQDPKDALYDFRVTNRKQDSLQLVRDPVVISGDMTWKHSMHFYRGCAYSISMWVFLYRPKSSEYERVIFSTAHLTGTPGSGVDASEDEVSDLPPAMLPFVLTGVGTGDDKDRMFVGNTRDPHGMYHGFWARSGPPVMYEEWMHISITVSEDNFLKIYQNGDLAGQSALDYQTGPNDAQCPYNHLTKESDVGPLADLTEYSNNTAFYVMNSHNNIVSSTSGLVQQVSVLRNIAVTKKMVRRIQRSTPPPGVDFLVHLLRSYGHYSYNRFSPLEVLTESQNYHHSSASPSAATAWALGSFYAELDWRVCPQAVCGPVSFNPQWVLGVPTRDVFFFYGGRNDAAMDEGVAHEHNAEIPAKDGLPAIRADGMRRKRNYRCKSRRHRGGTRALKRMQAPELAENGEPSPDEPIWEVWNGEHLLNLTTSIMTRIVDYIGVLLDKITDKIMEAIMASDEDAGVSCPRDTPGAFKRLRYLSGHPAEVKATDRDPRVNWTGPGERTRRRKQRAVQDLYHCGMLWLHGTYYDRAAPGSTTLRYDIELCNWLAEPFLTYSQHKDDETLYPRMSRIKGREMAVSAFALASWFAEEMYMEYPQHVRKLPWPFRSSALLSQPLHQALATQYGWDRSEQVRLPEDLGLLLKDHLAERLNVVEYYTKRASPGLRPQLQQAMRRQDYSVIVGMAHEQLGELVLDVYCKDEERGRGGGSGGQLVPNEALSKYLELKLFDNMYVYEGYADGNFQLETFRNTPWLRVCEKLSKSAEFRLGPSTSGEKDSEGDGRVGLHPALGDPAIDREEFARVLMEHDDTLPGRFKPGQVAYREKVKWEALTRDEKRKDYSRREDRHIETVPGVTENDSVQFSRCQAASRSVLGRETTIDMHAAAAHLFPVSQYAAANYGAEGSGVAYVEEIFVSRPDEFWMLTGAEDNPMIQYDEAQANAGDVDAQLMVARRHYWGNQGLEPQPAVAAQWYERAAQEHNNPEALYNLGVLHANGQGGYQRNMGRALEYFGRAADPPDGQLPFAMAVYAMGSHYLHDTREFSKAVDYLLRACHLGSSDAHYTLGTLYVDRYEVETGIVHLVQAANAQHVRALNYLAHGLYDPDSWLFMFHRRRQQKERERPGTPKRQRKRGTVWSDEKEKLREVALEWEYDPTVPLEVHIGGTVVRIPQPLGTGNTIPAAMHILKAISSMTYRVSDLLRAGAAAYNANDEVTALEHFSEAAELGLVSAQENAAMILEKMEKDVCVSGAYRGSDAGIALGLDGVPLLASKGTAAKSFVFSSSVACRRYFKNAAMGRWVQLANNNDLNAKKVLAGYASSGANLHGFGTANTTEASLLLAYAAELGDVESLLNLGWVFWDPSFPYYSPTTTDILFAKAREWETSAAVSAQPMLDRDVILYTGTLGFAPFLAQAWLYFYPWYSESFWFAVVPSIWHAWSVFLHAFYNEGYRFIHGREPPMHSFTPYLHLHNQQEMLESLRSPSQKADEMPVGQHPYLHDFNVWREKFTIDRKYKSVRYDRLLSAAIFGIVVVIKLIKIWVVGHIF